MTASVLEINDVLNQLLDKFKLSEAELGRVIGVPRATINRIASGRTPDPRGSTLCAIAEYFNVTVDQLLGKQPLFTQSEVSNSRVQIPIIEWHDSHDWEQRIKPLQAHNHFNWVLTESTVEVGKFALRMKGDAMRPQFQENSILIIDPIRQRKNRDFVVVHIKKSDEVLFRQLVIDGNYKFIKAINDIFPTIQLQDSDKIIGVVTQTITNLT